MISVEQWRIVIGCFQPRCSLKTIATYNEGIHMFYAMLYYFFWFVFGNIKLYGSCIFSMLHLTCKHCVESSSISFLLYIKLILLLSNDIELNPGPGQSVCPKCSRVLNAKQVCQSCGYNARAKPDVLDFQPQPKRNSRTKQCPECSSFVPNRKMVCTCGYDFAKGVIIQPALIGKVRKEKKRVAIAEVRSRQSPADVLKSSEEQRSRMASLRASESSEAAEKRCNQSRMLMASLRASESPEASEKRKSQNKLHMASLRASESPEASAKRNIQSRLLMASLRASESPEASKKRKNQNKLFMASLRASESPEACEKRNSQSKLLMASLRASESPESAKKRRAQSKQLMASLRASEPQEVTSKHNEESRLRMSSLRNRVLPENELVAAFQQKIKEGPDFVCSVCHRMMYKSGVCPYNKSKYTKTSDDVLNLIASYEYICSDGRQWVCTTCDRELKNGRMPVQAKANGLELCDIPPELSDLNQLELRLICLRVPFMKLVALPTGKQKSIHGPTINVPSKLDTICSLLPRLPSQTNLIPLKFKRKLNFKGHYLYDYVRPDKVMKALSWLKNNNPLYSDVCVNSDWAAVSNNENPDLFNSLVGNEPEPRHNVCKEVITEYDRHYNILVKMANEHGFVINDVIGGSGDCLFNAVAYQLDNIRGSMLREKIVDYLRKHPFIDGVHQGNFVSGSPLLSIDRNWEEYLEQLSNGAWGDHIVVQGLSNLLKIKINVFMTNGESVVVVVPTNDESILEVNVGLIGENHYVGLDAVNNINSELDNVNSNNNNNSDDIFHLNDDTIEEGDEHTRQITGGPQACSLLSAENPEAEGQMYSVAPAEGQHPISIMTDANFELMCNPDKFPFGSGGFNQTRPRKITYRKYFQQRLLDVNGRFARDLDYLFSAQYIVESKQVFDDASNFIWRQKPSADFTASQARNKDIIGESVRRDRAYAFLKNVRGSPAYYQRTFYDLLAMIRQLDTPTWFLTLSAADLKWAEVIQTIAKQYGVVYTDEEVSRLSFEERSGWVRRNPATAARHFQYRVDVFFKNFLKSSTHPLGEISDEAIRIEFQNRGSPHAHCLLWVKNAPKFGKDPDSVVCQFIDKYISCCVPDDNEELRDIVLSVQQHKHSKYCRRHNQCRFGFPHPPSLCTLISKAFSEEDEDACTSDDATKILSKVRKLLIEGNTNLSLSQLLEMANINSTEYQKALSICSRGNKIILKRDPQHCNINNYNRLVLLAWLANMDLQFIMDAYACVMYVASYILKHEKELGELLRNVANEFRTEELSTQLRKVGTAFLTNREVSAQEAAYRILSMPMKRLSRSVIFVDTNPKHQRIAVLKTLDQLNQLEEDDTNVFQKNLIERYQHRPRSIQSMCLAEFAATYVVQYRKDDEEETDVLPVDDSDKPSNQIVLTDGFGKMYMRRRQAVIRFHRYNKDSEPSNWHRAKLMLYFPWYDEQSDLLGGYATYEEHYRNVINVVTENEQKFTAANVDEVDIEIDGRPQHAWDILAPSSEESRVRSQAEGEESLTNITDEDLRHNSRILESGNNAARYESAATISEIPPDEYRRLMRELNSNQRAVVMYHRDWCKKAVLAQRNGQPVKPYRVFMSGPGGVGKSHVIRLIHSDSLKLLKLSGCVEPGDVTVLLTAPTGVAAFNIGGMTLHSALFLNCGRFGYQPLSSERLNTLRSRLSKLMLIVIDEVSMVGSNMLLEVHRRLQQIKGVSPDLMFGNVSILAVGDLYQLPPVGQPAVFDKVSDTYAQLYASGSLWKEEFEIIELTEVMRQKGDTSFVELLGRVRTGACTDNDLKVLQSRVVTPDDSDYPSDALHVYRLNVDVDKRNEEMLSKLAPDEQQYHIESRDSIGGQTNHVDLAKLSSKRSETGGLHGTLKLVVGARVMLTANVDVSDGLVNGARGEVVHVATDSNDKVVKVLVRFDNPSVGKQAIQQSSHRNVYRDAVPLNRHEATFLAKGKRGSEVIRSQFPLTLAWATTIHKVQGLTLDKIVVDMQGARRFSPGQAYVAFSRVKTLNGLNILNFDASGIKKNEKVTKEMIRLQMSKCLTGVPPLKCRELVSGYVTIALLNVRCVCAKLCDLMCDDNLRCADILCLCETWLSPSQNLPILKESHKTLRSDRVFPNNKGGVLMSIDESFSHSDVHKYSNNGIEYIVTCLKFPNDTPVIIVLLYRSPNTSLSQFENVLLALVSQLPSSCVTIILGDFNDCISNGKSRMVNVMSHVGFNQFVTAPTTDWGNLIDHVYCNTSLPNVVVEVGDCYYSDHDTVFVSIPFNDIGHASINDSISNSSVNKSVSDQYQNFQNPSQLVPQSSLVPDVSCPNFRFFQVEESWQRNWCMNLNIPYCSTYPRTIGSASTVLTMPDFNTIKVITSDGNCLFRSFSYVLTGSQQHHLLVRSRICNHMTTISHLVLGHIHPYRSVADYIGDTRMNTNSVWGTDIEVFTFANMCQTNVYVYSVERTSWNIYSPMFSLANFDVSTPSVYLIHPPGHYNVVRSVI